MQTVDPDEIERFSRIAAEWWDPHGKFKPLHRLNPTRLAYLRDCLTEHFRLDAQNAQPLSGLRLLDIGCGGGLISEPMARLGANVTGVDASKTNIGVAGEHARQMGLAIDYRIGTAEELLAQGEQFDAVLALEIIEHVADGEAFVRACMGLARPGGMVLFSTINRTLKARALAIGAAEYVLGWLPRGTHTYDKFVRPSELAAFVRGAGGRVHAVQGMSMHPLTFQWQMTPEKLDVNYFLLAVKD